MRTLRKQLNDARIAAGWSVQDLLDRTGLDLDISSLGRKLRTSKNSLRLNDDEIERIVDTFRKHGFAITVQYPPPPHLRAAA